MNEFMQSYMKSQEKIYEKLCDKYASGEKLTIEEVILMNNYKSLIAKTSYISPFKKILNGVQDIINLINVNNSSEEIIEENEEDVL